MTNYVNPFTGQTISPSQVGYESLTISGSSGSITYLNWPINGTTSTNVAANITEINATSSGLIVAMPQRVKSPLAKPLLSET